MPCTIPTLPKTSRLALAAVALSAAAVVGSGLQSSAEACGGFFCSQVPVDQTGEQILFAQEGDSIEAHVNIQYQGPAESFAWIVPTPSEPEVGVSTSTLFQQLEWRTGIQFYLDWEGDNCFFWGRDEAAAGGGNNGAPNDGGVTVVQQSTVGPYDFAVLQAQSTEALFAWLQDNDYDLPDNVMPFVEPYVQAGGDIHFVAFRLQKERDVGDLTPVRLKYTSARPMIPIQLTAIATQPDLGVTVHILGPKRAVPENYLHVHINEARIDWLTGGGNYDDVVTLAMDEAGGQGFHTEFAGAASVMEQTLFAQGWFDTGRLADIQDPVAFIDELMRQQFRGNPQLLSMFQRYIPFPEELAQQGVTPQDFYNNLEAYREHLDVEGFDAEAFANELEMSIVEPLEHSQTLFDTIPYLTRMYTTLSAEEMTRDPSFVYNSDMADVDNIRRAMVSSECSDPNDPQSATLTITLSNGHQFVTAVREDWTLDVDESAPAAGVIEETRETGQPLVVRDIYNNIDNLDEVLEDRDEDDPIRDSSLPAGGGGNSDSGCACAQLSAPEPWSRHRQGATLGLMVLGFVVGLRRSRSRRRH